MNDIDIKDLKEKVEHNNRRIDSNSDRISQNTGAIEVLHTIKTFAIMFFIMWLITFIALLISLC